MKTFKIELTTEETNLVLAALQELPYKMTAALLKNLEEQLKPQVQVPETGMAQQEGELVS